LKLIKLCLLLNKPTPTILHVILLIGIVPRLKNSQVQYLHSSFHGGQVSKGDLTSCKFPQEDSKTPHVCGLRVDHLWSLAKCLGCHPGWVIGLAPVLEREGSIGHVDARSQFVIRQNINLLKMLYFFVIDAKVK